MIACPSPSCKSTDVMEYGRNVITIDNEGIKTKKEMVTSYRCRICSCFFPVEPHEVLSMYDKTPIDERHKE